MGRDVWLVASDLHCGSTLGLCPPYGAPLDDGGLYLPSEAQKALWSCWLDMIGQVEGTLRPGDALRVCLNGDVYDGDHHRTAQIVSKNLAATQHEIAVEVLRPLLALDPASIFVVRGTEAHVGASAQWEERLARQIGAVECPETNASSWWHLQVESEGVLLDFAHHGRLGTRPWTKLTGLSTLVSEIIGAAATHGTPIPHLAVRSHYHQWADTADNYACRLIQLAGWQLSTAFVHRIAAGSIPHVGGLILICEQGNLEVVKVKYPWKRASPVTLSARPESRSTSPKKRSSPRTSRRSA